MPSDEPPFDSDTPRPTGQVRGFPGTAGAVDPAAAIKPPFITCRKCGGPIREQYRFGSPETGWEHMPGECLNA